MDIFLDDQVGDRNKSLASFFSRMPVSLEHMVDFLFIS